MVKELKISAEPRDQRGTSAARRLRKMGLLPAIVYGEGAGVEMIQVKEHELSQMLRYHASTNVLMDLAVGGQPARKVLLQDVHQHPISGRFLHADFRLISMTKRLRIKLPIKLTGEPVGVSQQGGILEHILHEVEVECLPEHIVEHVALDVSGLSIGDHLTVTNLNLDPAKYHALTGADVAVAAVSAPRAEEEVAPAAEAAEGAAAAEPEVIREKKDAEDEAAEGDEKKKAPEGKKPAEEKKKPAEEKKKSEK
jgi:large subunit ribosomal protein L25